MKRDLSGVFSYKFKLFIQGIEIPFAGAEIQFSAQSYFNIEIPPINEVNELLPGTYGLIAFKRFGAADKWHLLCEGVYMGPNYSKQGTARSLRLKFRDLQWFPENTPFYSIMEAEDKNETMNFGLTIQAFVGDVRREERGPGEVRILPTAAKATSRFTFLQALMKDTQEDYSPLGDMIDSLFSELERGNKFISEHAKSFKINGNRVKAIENKKMAEVYVPSLLEMSFEMILMETGALTSVMEIILMLMQHVHYDLMPIPGLAEDESGALRSYVAKPHLALVVPPACNVIFPDELINFGYSIDYSLRPTRLWFRGHMQETGSNYGYFAPRELEEGIRALASGESLPETGGLTDEELMRGVNHQILRLPHAYTVPLVLNNEEEWGNYHSRFVDYTFHEMKYSSTPMSITTAFKPDLVPGFPILLLDQIIPMIGYCVNVAHSIDISSGAAFTSVTLSHVRPATEEIPLLAGWYDSAQFHPENIGAQVYKHLHTHSFWQPMENYPVMGEDIKIDKDGMVDCTQVIFDLIDEYQKNSLGNLAGWKSGWARELPVFYSELEEEGAILDSLNLKWNRESERLETKNLDQPSPLNIDITIKGTKLSELRAEPVIKLKKTLTSVEGLWTRHLD